MAIIDEIHYMSYWIGVQSNELEDFRQNQKKLKSRLKTTMERQTNYKPKNAQQNEQNDKKIPLTKCESEFYVYERIWWQNVEVTAATLIFITTNKKSLARDTDDDNDDKWHPSHVANTIRNSRTKQKPNRTERQDERNKVMDNPICVWYGRNEQNKNGHKRMNRPR